MSDPDDEDTSRRPMLATRRTGTGDRLVLVHGFTQTGRSWAAVTRHLEARFEVVTVDLPDHGGSSGISARDLDDAGDLVAQAGGRGTYVGYSLGGRACLHSAFGAPEVVERLVLVSATPGIANASERVARRAADEQLAARLEASGGQDGALQGFISEWLAGPLFAHLSDQAAGAEARLENSLSSLARSLRTVGTGTQRYDPERIAALEMPVLVVAGEMDERFVSTGRQLARMIGDNATFHSIPGVGHAAPFEDPPGFASLVEKWCRAH